MSIVTAIQKRGKYLCTPVRFSRFCVLDRDRVELLDEPRYAALQQLRDLVRHLLHRGRIALA